MYCENITTFIKSHLNRKYAMDFFPKSLQEMKQSVLAKHALYDQNKQFFGKKVRLNSIS